ncbi:TPA: helix-turn-helix domain-containing protein [Serratia liquefaciens]
MQPMTTNTNHPDLIARLTELNQKGISKADMSRIAGVSKQAVSGWFKTGTISKKSALAISEAAGVSVAWLYGESVEEKSGLAADEVELLHLYRQLPEAEQKNMIAAFSSRLKELDDFVEKYVRKRVKTDD